MIKIKLSTDFTDTPGGRYANEGSFSGEEFRNKILKPKYLLSIQKGEKLIVDMDGCYGFPSSFIDESFGGLSRELKDNILLNLDIVCTEQPSLYEEISKCMYKQGE